ncbi:hypothetical protein [Pseudomonas sp. MWU12-2323]|uniref:hypothetical protein n=1 Tax=Pseudomonas sp. MWU12-2323 TaxID=2651296 RepID=UPI00128E8DA4|nr:hypothetical protein [Pseudomonas sp. MWU12-2323]MPQ69295.1 hypothetical protein [Pseudomonas sp. MWU12-2323]
MKKLKIFALAVAAAVSTGAFADGAEDDLLTRNRSLDEMTFIRDRLHLQADMAKSFKEMKDAGVIVDSKGVPMGIGDMERFALEVSRRGGTQPAQGFNPLNPFSGAAPGAPMPAGQNLFGDTGFGPTPTTAPVATSAPAKPAETKDEKVEVVAKPTEREKSEGKQILRLVELRGQTAVFFTNDGFKEVPVGGSIYGMKLASIGADSAKLRSKDGTRLVRIDWTKSVRYLDN